MWCCAISRSLSWMTNVRYARMCIILFTSPPPFSHTLLEFIQVARVTCNMCSRGGDTCLSVAAYIDLPSLSTFPYILTYIYIYIYINKISYITYVRERLNAWHVGAATIRYALYVGWQCKSREMLRDIDKPLLPINTR